MLWSVESLTDGTEHAETYATVGNVIRFGLAKDTYPTGQYDIYPTDADGIRTGEPVRAFKRV